MAAGKGKGTYSVLYIAAAFIIGVVVALVVARYYAPEFFIVEDDGADTAIVIDETSVAEVTAVIPTLIPDDVTVAKYRLAIVIDDMGRDIGSLNDIIELELPITVSVLPHLRRSRDVAVKAHANGLDVLLHMPMEPLNSEVNDPGEGAVLTSMSAEEIRRTLIEAVDSLPNIIGINNHMGSKFTAHTELMGVLLEELKSKELFFLDSKTTAKSVAEDIARDLELTTLARDVFLDNEEDQSYIEGQLRKATALAKRKGTAIAIGHPYPETIDAIKAVMAEGDFEGVTIVGVSELIE